MNCSTRELIVSAVAVVSSVDRLRRPRSVLVLIVLAELLRARAEHVGGGLAAGLDFLGHGLGAADQQFLEAADARVEIVGDLHRARAERLVDVVDLGAERVGELGAAHIDHGGDVADALVERGDDLLAALGQRLGDIHDAARRAPR